MGASLWLQPRRGFSLLGIGEAWAARPAAGPHRFSAASAAWSTLLAGALIDSRDAPRGAGPLLLGGFSFDDAPAPSALWQGFEPACLVLPSLLLTSSADGAWLTLSWRVGVSPDPASIAQAWEALAQAAGEFEAAPAGSLARRGASARAGGLARLGVALGRRGRPWSPRQGGPRAPGRCRRQLADRREHGARSAGHVGTRVHPLRRLARQPLLRRRDAGTARQPQGA